MALRADDKKAAGSLGLVVELDIRTTACHVCRDRHRAVLAGMGNDFRLDFMVLRVQDVMLDTGFSEHAGQQFRCLNCDGADQNRLPFGMRFLNSFHNRVEFLLLGFVNGILQIYSRNRLVRRDFDDIHSVDFTEFLFLGQRRTGHTALLVKFVEEVLESNRRQGL